MRVILNWPHLQQMYGQRNKKLSTGSRGIEVQASSGYRLERLVVLVELQESILTVKILIGFYVIVFGIVMLEEQRVLPDNRHHAVVFISDVSCSVLRVKFLS